MTDLISRQAAIDTLATGEELLRRVLDDMDVVGNEREKYEWGLGLIESYIADMKDLPSAQPEQRWIPVSERLPEEDKDVLVTVYFKGLVQKHKTGWNDHIKPKSYVEVASQIDGEWHSYSDEYKVARDRHVVTAWMPLPEPYKEEE